MPFSKYFKFFFGVFIFKKLITTIVKILWDNLID